MPEPTLEEIKSDLVDALNELNEILKRLKSKLTRGKLASNSQTAPFEPAIWSPSQTNEDTTDADLQALSIPDLNTWLSQNIAEVERLMEPT